MSDENVGGLVELLPCPFCGSEDIDSPTRYARYGRCNDCDTFGPTAAYDLDPSACVSNGIAAWNRRALSAHGQPVVDGRMARGWRNRFISAQTELNQRANGNDYELARAYAEATANEYEEALIAALGDTP